MLSVKDHWTPRHGKLVQSESGVRRGKPNNIISLLYPLGFGCQWDHRNYFMTAFQRYHHRGTASTIGMFELHDQARAQDVLYHRT